MTRRSSDDTAINSRLQEVVHYSELKQLAYNIATLQQEKMFRSLAVLSFLPAEGKTLFCAALAMAYVETCRARVLLVDSTTIQNKGSLALRDCFNGSDPMIEVISLADLRNGSSGLPPSPARYRADKEPVLESEVINDMPSMSLSVFGGTDLSLIKRVSAERSKQYGLVLLDTAPLSARNKNNVDPLLVAHMSDASLLVVSRKFLDAPNLNASLKVLKDPALHLLGLVSNEAHP
jgi:Mrp family chromosome partitioning ATPase